LLAQGAHAWCLVQEVQRCGELVASSQSGLAPLLPAGHSMWGTLELARAQLDLAHGDLASAQAALKRAATIFDGAGEVNRIGIRVLTLLARTELQAGEVAAAQQHAAQAVTQAQESLAGFDHSEWLGSALVARGLVHQARQEAGAARDSWRAALIELRVSVGEEAPSYVEARELLERLPSAQQSSR
jgi:hypothetical protein